MAPIKRWGNKARKETGISKSSSILQTKISILIYSLKLLWNTTVSFFLWTLTNKKGNIQMEAFNNKARGSSQKLCKGGNKTQAEVATSLASESYFYISTL